MRQLNSCLSIVDKTSGSTSTDDLATRFVSISATLSITHAVPVSKSEMLRMQLTQVNVDL